MIKRVFLIWDLDGAIGQINSTYPYNFHYDRLEEELDNVRYALDKMDEFGVKSCFAITGFSAEDGKYPYVFPDLIREIDQRGHEIASHSWRHEWAPIFRPNQILLSLKRSKSALETCLPEGTMVTGFVPPHNRPMTWWRKGAFSLGDRGLYPFFQMADNGQLLKALEKTGYKWIRISSQSVFQKLGIRSRSLTGRTYAFKGIHVFENHYAGFDQTVIRHILETHQSTYTISAHPAMLSLENKAESKKNFEAFLTSIGHDSETRFETPTAFISDIAGGV